MNFLDTPEERFGDLPNFDYEPHFVSLADGMRIHYVDVGPRDALTCLLLHGEPSWSFLYRKMIPILLSHGYRCVAPDLIGFGRSSKPTEQESYSYDAHIGWMSSFMSSVDMDRICLFAQDWGGLIGLRIVPLFESRFVGIAISNTGLPTGEQKPTKAFLDWQKFSQKVESFPFEFVMQGATTSELDTATLAGYRAPFPDDRYTAGAKIFPALVPTSVDSPGALDNKKVWKDCYSKWTKPFVTLFGDGDPVTKGGEAPWQKIVPGAKGQKHEIIKGGGHFIQEDCGPELATALHQFIIDNSLA